MLHDILHTTVQNVAQPVDGVGFHIQILAESVKLGAVNIVVRIEVVLRNTTLFHGFPQPVVSNQMPTSNMCLT